MYFSYNSLSSVYIIIHKDQITPVRKKWRLSKLSESYHFLWETRQFDNCEIIFIGCHITRNVSLFQVQKWFGPWCCLILFNTWNIFLEHLACYSLIKSQLMTTSTNNNNWQAIFITLPSYTPWQNQEYYFFEK